MRRKTSLPNKFFKLRVSAFRVTGWAGFLSVALGLGLVLWFLPHWLTLDALRPKLTSYLEETSQCKVLMGNVRAELLPYPGFVVDHVVFLERSPAPRVLASAMSVHLWIAIKPLRHRHLRFRTVRFYRPRFLLHRLAGPQRKTRWVFLALPSYQPSTRGHEVWHWEIRQGSLEIWDHSRHPTTRWIFNRLSGSFQARTQTGDLKGRAPCLGRRCLLEIHYGGSEPWPFQARLEAMHLAALRSLAPSLTSWLDGSADLTLQARLGPPLTFRVAVPRLALARLSGVSLKGGAFYENDHLHLMLQTVSPTPVIAEVEGTFPKGRWLLQATLKGYDAQIVRKFYDNPWLNQLTGPGTVAATVAASTGAASLGGWSWSAVGRDFAFGQTPFQVPQWSAQGDTQTVSVQVDAVTRQGGALQVAWSQSRDSDHSELQVEAGSVTIRQILQIFHVPPSTGTPTRGGNARGYEPWLITQGRMRAILHSGPSLEVQQSSIVVAGMPLDLSGTFGLGGNNREARIQGSLRNIPMSTAWESFLSPPAPVSGTGQTTFVLAFPLSAEWLREFNGTLQIHVDRGMLRTFKTFYRIASVLNLSNYLSLRLPQIAAQGIVFQNIEGHLTFQNGVVSSQDLFLKSPNMNVGARGSVNLPGQTLDVTLRVQLLRFVEDVLKSVPGLHWLLSRGNKILLPLVVSVRGPWNNPDIDVI